MTGQMVTPQGPPGWMADWLIRKWPRLGLTLYGAWRCGLLLWRNIKATDYKPYKDVFTFEYRLRSDNRLPQFREHDARWAGYVTETEMGKDDTNGPTIH